MLTAMWNQEDSKAFLCVGLIFFLSVLVELCLLYDKGKLQNYGYCTYFMVLSQKKNFFTYFLHMFFTFLSFPLSEREKGNEREGERETDFIILKRNSHYQLS